MSREVIILPSAPDTIRELAQPQVHAAAEQLARSIVEQVPVQSGSARGAYEKGLRVEDGESGSVRVTGFPFLWHWLEYGTRFNVPYRPIANAVQSLGLRWEPK